MVLLAGPRQAGKTTLAKDIAKEFPNSTYLNYDRIQDRKIMKDESWLPNTDLLILDEIHKMPKWKNYLKGIFDTKSEKLKILVTGSARLDLFRQAGDSLAGRYFLHHLLPLSPAELHQAGLVSDLDRFLYRGGFPEPYLAPHDIDANRWRLQYVDSLLREDVLEVEHIQDLRAMQLVFDLLRERVGSTISYTSIAEDASIAPNTVKRYIQIFEALYIVFRVTPFARNIARSLSKEPKIYFFDTGLVKGDTGARLENFTAVCLLKHVFARNDYKADRCSLNYLRTKEKHEVDFALIEGTDIETIIEVKSSYESEAKGLKYFSSKYKLPAIQAIKNLKRERIEAGIQILDIHKYLQSLSL